jgi:hypothetical protein
MQHLETLTEADMIAAFLRGEIASERFGATIQALLKRDGRDPRVVEAPDVANEADNTYRRQLLGDFRGYGQDRELFQFFPADVAWHRYALSRAELARVRYVDYSYWNELSGGSRLPADAARNVRAGKVVFGQSSQRFWDVAHALERGATFPEPILAGTAPGADLVLLEGHVRLTAYFLAPEHLPEELTAIVGFSPALTRWLALPEATAPDRSAAMRSGDVAIDDQARRASQ